MNTSTFTTTPYRPFRSVLACAVSAALVLQGCGGGGSGAPTAELAAGHSEEPSAEAAQTPVVVQAVTTSGASEEVQRLRELGYQVFETTGVHMR